MYCERCTKNDKKNSDKMVGYHTPEIGIAEDRQNTYHLPDDLRHGRSMPVGRLRETELVSRLGVSRIPLRGAIRLL